MLDCVELHQIDGNTAALEACLKTAMLARSRGDRPAALSAFGIAAAFAPRDGRLQIEIARELMDLGRRPEAKAILEDLVQDEVVAGRALALLEAHFGRSGRH